MGERENGAAVEVVIGEGMKKFGARRDSLRHARSCHPAMRWKIRVALVPPKPNAFDMTVLIRNGIVSRAILLPTAPSASMSGSSVSM